MFYAMLLYCLCAHVPTSRYTFQNYFHDLRKYFVSWPCQVYEIVPEIVHWYMPATASDLSASDSVFGTIYVVVLDTAAACSLIYACGTKPIGIVHNLVYQAVCIYREDRHVWIFDLRSLYETRDVIIEVQHGSLFSSDDRAALEYCRRAVHRRQIE